MTTYYSAPSDDAALTAPSSGTETLESPLAVDSDAFAFLVDLVAGEDEQATDLAEEIVVLDTAGPSAKIVRIGSALRDTVADLDEEVLQSLAEPWSANTELQGLDLDPTDFLTDFQHLCRNAAALEADVYAIERL